MVLGHTGPDLGPSFLSVGKNMRNRLNDKAFSLSLSLSLKKKGISLFLSYPRDCCSTDTDAGGTEIGN